MSNSVSFCFWTRIGCASFNWRFLPLFRVARRRLPLHYGSPTDFSDLISCFQCTYSGMQDTSRSCFNSDVRHRLIFPMLFKSALIRRIAFKLHFYVGMGLGLWLVLVSLTGSLIVFRGEIEDALHQNLTRVKPGTNALALESIWKRVVAAHPSAVFHTANLPTSPNVSISFWGHDEKGRSFHTYANPHTGELLGDDLAANNITEWIYLFHAQLLGQGTGERINGLGAIAWLVLFASGVFLWLPRLGRPWKDGFIIRINSQARRRTYDLHRVVGIWSVLPLLMVVVTGAYFPFKAPFRWLAETVTRSVSEESSPEARRADPGAKRATLDAVLAAAEEVLPGVSPNWIHLPDNEQDVFSVRKRLPGEWRSEGANYIHVDQYSCKIVRADLQAERSPAQQFLSAMFPLHFGTFGGPTTRILWTALGLVPAWLFFTGIRMWRSGRRKSIASSDS